MTESGWMRLSNYEVADLLPVWSGKEWVIGNSPSNGEGTL